MRWVNVAVVVALAAAMLIFALQNLQVATVSFLGLQFSAPLALQVVIIYLLGMITGSGLSSMVRWAFQGLARVE